MSRYTVPFLAIVVAFLLWLLVAVRSVNGETATVPTVPAGEPGPSVPARPPTGNAAHRLELATLKARVRWQHRHLVAAHHTIRRLQARLSDRVASLVYLVDAFQCVHRYEGGWGAATGNGYYGGLQFDYGFMRAYAPELLERKGTADQWTPAEQIATAIAAHAERGFGPWPNTARMCGLR